MDRVIVEAAQLHRLGVRKSANAIDVFNADNLPTDDIQTSSANRARDVEPISTIADPGAGDPKGVRGKGLGGDNGSLPGQAGGARPHAGQHNARCGQPEGGARRLWTRQMR